MKNSISSVFKSLNNKITKYSKVLRIFKKFLFGLIIFLGCVFLLMGFYIGKARLSCRLTPQPVVSYKQVESELNSKLSGIEGYYLPEDGTYLTYPEWYIVFAAQENARFLEHNSPSGFAYFGVIDQYWCGYSYMYDEVRNRYPFNSGDHLMDIVIGTSFTTEYAVKGIYENTFGRIYELFGSQTEEDIFSYQVATSYGNFLPHTPWYDYSFLEKLGDLWTEVPLFGRNPIRKLERRIILSGEYLIKGIYGSIIKYATESTYAPAEERVNLVIEGNLPEDIDPRIAVIHKTGNQSLLSLPRYDVFNQVLYKLAENSVDVVEIAGNKEILVTVIAPKDFHYSEDSSVVVVFEQPILTESNKKRIGFKVAVSQLNKLLMSFKFSYIQIEHVFDY